jgi:hypothetical protein
MHATLIMPPEGGRRREVDDNCSGAEVEKEQIRYWGSPGQSPSGIVLQTASIIALGRKRTLENKSGTTKTALLRIEVSRLVSIYTTVQFACMVYCSTRARGQTAVYSPTGNLITT